MPGPPVYRGGRQEDGLEAELLDAAASLLDRAAHVMGRHHPRPVHAVRREVAEVLHPVVVGTGDGGGELGLEAVTTDLFGGVEAQHKQATEG